MSAKLKLWKQRVNKEGAYPVVVVIQLKGKRRVIYSGIYAREEHWDQRTENVKKGHPAGRVAQMHLQELLLKYQNELLLALRDDLPVAAFGSSVNLKENFFAFGERQVELLLQKGSLGNAKVYRQSLAAFEGYAGSSITFGEINFSLLKAFRDAKLKAGMKETGINSYMRTLRAIWNLAELEVHSPFKKGLIINEPRRIARNHSLDDVRKIFAYSPTLPKEKRIQLALNLWRLGFLLAGMDLVDLLSLQQKNVSGNYLIYKRQKTDQELKVLIPARAIEIFKPFEGKKMLFDVLKAPITSEKQMKQYVNLRSNLNRSLKLVSDRLKLSQRITTKTCRFSFATIARDLDVSDRALKALLGHVDKSTTALYLGSLPQKIVDNAQMKVINEIILPDLQ
jgi:integrase